jgi:hypothetical protein
LGPDEADGNSVQSWSQERTTGIFVLGRERETHQESRFIGVAVVTGATAHALEAELFVERDCGGVGFADFQKNLLDGRCGCLMEKI